MYNSDRVRETTTTTGTGTITLAGAATQHQTFASRVQVNDPCPYCIMDGNGTGWEIGEGTLLTSTTLSRDTVYQSSNSDALLSLSANTHTVFLTFAADKQNKNAIMGDFWIDHVVTGLVTPTSSGSLSGAVSTGTAYSVGQRVRKGAQTHTYTASKDTYVDVTNAGALIYVPVSNGAGAPAITANSIRLGKVVSAGSTITGGTDLRNMVRTPTCYVCDATGVTTTSTVAVAMPFATLITSDSFDNASMHSTTVNNTRVTAQYAGLYLITAQLTYNSVTGSGPMYVQGAVNGSVRNPLQNSIVLNSASGAYPSLGVSATLYLFAGDYVELLALQFTGSNQTAGVACLGVTRIG